MWLLVLANATCDRERLGRQWQPEMSLCLSSVPPSLKDKQQRLRVSDGAWWAEPQVVFGLA